LHTLPLDALKIDRSFVSRMDGPNLQIVNTIILLAQGLGLDVVAEGIETREQMQQLGELACEFGQGYLFGSFVDMTQVNKSLSIPPTPVSIG
jgi:EAL domain-containing protein (putative c-di-GMP-specific phosphodiesterase class I)